MKPKIMFLLRPVKGGVKEHVRLLIDNLSSFFNIVVVCPPEEELINILQRAGSHIITLDTGEDFKLTRDLRNVFVLDKIIRREKVKLLHLHGFKAGFLGRLASPLNYRVPVVLTVHNFVAHQEKTRLPLGFFYLAENILSRRTNRIITVSQTLKRNLVYEMGIKDNKILTIYNCICLLKNNNEETSITGCGTIEKQGKGRVPLVGTAARFAPQKGISDFIEAARIIQDKGLECKFMVAGDGPLRSELEEQVNYLELSEHVCFPGYITDMPGFLSALEVFVLPSRSEGLSITLLEALAAGKPVVATAAGGIPEIIRDEITGCLVPPGDPRFLANSVIDLLNNNMKRKKLAQKGKEFVCENFNLEKMIMETKKVYEELLKGY